jgi:hypothetical protein
MNLQTNQFQIQRWIIDTDELTTDQFIETNNRDIDELTTDQLMNVGKKHTGELTNRYKYIVN